MSIWNKVLLGFLIVFALVFFYVAARTLRTHDAWRSQVNRLQSQLEQTEAQNQVLLEGRGDEEGIRQLRSKLFQVLANRGRVWYGTTVADLRTEPDQRRATVTLTLPEDYRAQDVDDAMIVYVFDQRPYIEGGRYLGEFKISGVGEGQIVLESTHQLNERQIEQLSATEGTWTVYEVMPRDRHDALAEFSEEELRERLPDATVEEFLLDGQEVDPQAYPPDRVVDGKYVRALRDYATLFAELDRQRTILVDQIESAKHDLASLEAAHADALEQQKFREAEIVATRAELAQLEKERDVVAAHREQLAKTLAQTRAEIQRAFAENRQLAAQLAQ